MNSSGWRIAATLWLCRDRDAALSAGFLPARLPKIGLQLGRLVLEHRPEPGVTEFAAVKLPFSIMVERVRPLPASRSSKAISDGN
jgi:hypothetical protein